jgi:hypothetical protein
MSSFWTDANVGLWRISDPLEDQTFSHQPAFSCHDADRIGDRSATLKRSGSGTYAARYARGAQSYIGFIYSWR